VLNEAKGLVGKEGDAKDVRVGIIGYSNVGKRSVHTMLKEYMEQENVGPLYEHVQLLPRPGVVFSADSPNSLVLKHVAQPEELGNPYIHVHALLKKVPKIEMLACYEIPDYGNTQDFLNKVARKQGELLKKGLPDYEATAKLVVKDWMEGKIHYYEECPESEEEVSLMLK
jgi:ribosome biogenesis GTPase A